MQDEPRTIDIGDIGAAPGQRALPPRAAFARPHGMARALPRLRGALLPWLFLLPALLLYGIVVVYPAISSLILSFYSWDGLAFTKKTFIGFQNYWYIITQDPVFKSALANNFIWTVFSLLVPTTAGLALALLLNQRFRGRTLFRGIFYLPFIVSSIAVGEMWNWIYYPAIGFLDSVLHALGLQSLELGWLSNPHLALYAVLVAAAWQGTGAPMVIFLAGLQTIPIESYEAAQVEGASAWQTLLYITLPLLFRETFVIIFSITLVGSLKVFDIVYAMTQGGPANSTQVLGTWMYFQTFVFNNVGEGAALSWVLVFLVTIVAVPYLLFMSRRSTV